VLNLCESAAISGKYPARSLLPLIYIRLKRPLRQVEHEIGVVEILGQRVHFEKQLAPVNPDRKPEMVDVQMPLITLTDHF
jgi:hypothetical protein